MCGRFTQVSALGECLDDLAGNWMPTDVQAEPNADVRPTAQVWTVVVGERGLEPGRMTWGFLPRWAGEDAKRQINARVETAATKPYFREAWRASRCLIPADGYYEWWAQVGKRRPWHIHAVDNRPLLMAGLHGTDPTGQVCFTIVTTAARGGVEKLHHRMPLLLDRPAALAWLARDAAPAALAALGTQPVPTELTWELAVSLGGATATPGLFD